MIIFPPTKNYPSCTDFYYLQLNYFFTDSYSKEQFYSLVNTKEWIPEVLLVKYMLDSDNYYQLVKKA